MAANQGLQDGHGRVAGTEKGMSHGLSVGNGARERA